MKWLTIEVNPPKLDEKIVVRTEDFIGLGRTIELIEFSSECFDEQGAVDCLAGTDFIEWLGLPE